MKFIKIIVEKDDEAQKGNSFAKKMLGKLKFFEVVKQGDEKDDFEDVQINDNFTLDWDKKLGWKGDPFKAEIIEPVDHFLAGYKKEKEKINLFFIKDYKFGLIASKPGFGKSSLLKWIEYHLVQYGDKFKINKISIDTLKNERQFIKDIAEPFLSVYEKRVGKPYKYQNSKTIDSFLSYRIGKTRTYVLLIDNIENLSNPALMILKALHDSKANVKIIATGNERALKKLNLEELGFKDELQLSLDDISFDEVREIIRLRIENLGGRDIRPLNNRILRHIYMKCQHNPAKIIRMCHDQAINISLSTEFQKPRPKEVKKEQYYDMEESKIERAIEQELGLDKND